MSDVLLPTFKAVKRADRENIVNGVINNFNGSCLAPTTGTAPTIFASALQFFAASQCLLYEKPLPDNEIEDGAKYDFIIVGGGSAGCVLANRLSEVKTWKILLIEAGPHPTIQSTIPGLDKETFLSEVDWKYYTQDNGRTNRANKNNSVLWNRGKMLGGCSSMNGMIYIRGSIHDYQKWYDAGNKDWHPKVVEECFVKAESLQDQHMTKDSRFKNFYGNRGPLKLNTFNSTLRPLSEKILQSWDEIGFKKVEDLNYANVTGCGITRVTAYNGRRGSTDHVYLKPARSRDNLYVITNSLVTKILVHEDTKEAYGVQVDKDGVTYNIFASHEIILSAGTINTPQLLMLSGIGPEDHLKSKNIKCLVNLSAVGKNLQDHLAIPVPIYSDDKAEKYLDVIKYIYNRTGYLAQSGVLDSLAFYSRDKKAKYPEFEIHVEFYQKSSLDLPQYLKFERNYKDIVADPLIEQNKNKTLILFLLNLLHPNSKGNILLKTSNPRDYPIINANYLSDPTDLQAAADGIMMLTKIVDTTFFKSIKGYLGRINWPECNSFKLDKEDYWKCIIVNTVVTIYHPIGTSRMGNNINSSVVNSQLKVHSMKKLRVIDASVIPFTTSGNTNGPVIMVAERGSSLIKREYGIENQSDSGCY